MINMFNEDCVKGLKKVPCSTGRYRELQNKIN